MNGETICRRDLSSNPAAGGIQSRDGRQQSASEDQEVLTCSTSNLGGFQVGLSSSDAAERSRREARLDLWAQNIQGYFLFSGTFLILTHSVHIQGLTVRLLTSRRAGVQKCVSAPLKFYLHPVIFIESIKSSTQTSRQKISKILKCHS